MAPFGFTIPSLPKPQYEFLQRVRKRYYLSQRQVVIAALNILESKGVEDRAGVEALFEEVKAAYPARVQREIIVE